MLIEVVIRSATRSLTCRAELGVRYSHFGIPRGLSLQTMMGHARSSGAAGLPQSKARRISSQQTKFWRSSHTEDSRPCGWTSKVQGSCTMRFCGASVVHALCEYIGSTSRSQCHAALPGAELMLHREIQCKKLNNAEVISAWRLTAEPSPQR